MLTPEIRQECREQATTAGRKQGLFYKLAGLVTRKLPEDSGLLSLQQFNIPAGQIGEYYDSLKRTSVLGGGYEGTVFNGGFIRGQNQTVEFANNSYIVTKLLYGQVDEAFMVTVGCANMDKLSKPGQNRVDMLHRGEYPPRKLLVYDRIARQHNLALEYPGIVAPIDSIIRMNDVIVGYQLPRYEGTWLDYAQLDKAEKQRLAPVARFIDKIGESNIVRTADGLLLVDVELPFI